MAIKLGFIARIDNSGLGSLSLEFLEHIRPFKVLAVKNGVYQTFPERVSQFNTRIVPRNYTKSDLEWLLDGIELLVAVETTYSPNAFALARSRGIKSILIPMYECTGLGKEKPDPPDLYICPSLLDLDEMPEPKVFLPFPVNRERVKFRQRKIAKVFLHNSGHGGMVSRNGTTELLKAIPMVKADVKFIIHSQTDLYCDDPRVEIRVGNFKNYWDLWHEGDVFVFPEKFNGLSLPINEALASGMVVMSSDRYPFNQWIPKEPLIPVRDYVTVKMARMVKYAIIQPRDIADRIEEYANRDIAELSKRSGEAADTISWQNLLPKYQQIFNDLCRK